MTTWIGFAISFGTGLFLVPGIRQISLRFQRVATPREDRWHRKPTPKLGGVAIYLSFLIGLLSTVALTNRWSEIRWELIAASSLVFLLGLYDDLKEITPPAKLVGQILIAAVAIFLGFSTNFFTPKIANSVLAQVPNIVLTFIWLVGLTNAINLLDNMDGLAGGISFITTGFLTYFFWVSQDHSLLPVSLALGGGILSFLVFNFPPASIFMGDSGSLFLGFTLALMAIARQPQASNVFAVMGVPTLLFMLPILDTTLVTITRLLRGQSPAQGGRDHTSHRLVAFGLSERQTLFVLYFVAIVSGVVAIAIESADYWLSLVLVPLLVLSLSILAAYLGRLKVVSSTLPPHPGAMTRFMLDLTYKRRTFEIGLDFILIGFAYYLSFWTRYGLSLNESALELFLRSLPIAYAAAYISFFVFGVYRGVWRYIGVDDLIRYTKATLGCIVLGASAIYILNTGLVISPVIFILFALFLFLGLAASRISFKTLDQFYGHQPKPKEERVLIIGAGDAGEMAVRWILMNPQFGLRPVGFLDEDPFNTGREIHGVGILGGFEQLDTVLSEKQIDGVLLTSDDRWSGDSLDRIINSCKTQGRWIRSLRLEFVKIE
jgi:UDP-GlcNAc:undecaprenyl-phosphate GlcNAc-1-phosphate transferase